MIKGVRTRGWKIIGGMVVAMATLAAAAQEAAPGDALSYEFGRGLRLGDTGFTLGGYATLEYRNVQGVPEQFKASHASVFVWWEGLGHAKVFAEIDALNSVTHDRRENDYDARRVSLERLYLDWAFSDTLTARAGKFLTPIGRWNQIHAEPLVWTTSGPLIAQSVFPRNVTGASVSGQWEAAGHELAWTVYASNGSEWRADRWQDPFSRVRGLRFVTPLPGGVQLGLSAANYELDSFRGQSRRLRGLDLFWARQGFEVTAEWLRTNRLNPQAPGPGRALPQSAPQAAGDTRAPVDAPGARDEPPPLLMVVPRRTSGGFVQGVVPLVAQWFLVLRTEEFADVQVGGTRRRQVAGLTWRPNPATALKFEWGEQTGPQPRQTSLACALSVLF